MLATHTPITASKLHYTHITTSTREAGCAYLQLIDDAAALPLLCCSLVPDHSSSPSESHYPQLHALSLLLCAYQLSQLWSSAALPWRALSQPYCLCLLHLRELQPLLLGFLVRRQPCCEHSSSSGVAH
jgi:hypothetical protein